MTGKERLEMLDNVLAQCRAAEESEQRWADQKWGVGKIARYALPDGRVYLTTKPSDMRSLQRLAGLPSVADPPIDPLVRWEAQDEWLAQESARD